jgi:diacylglycerol kinase family enzyme/uncharacterized membrane protein
VIVDHALSAGASMSWLMLTRSLIAAPCVTPSPFWSQEVAMSATGWDQNREGSGIDSNGSSAAGRRALSSTAVSDETPGRPTAAHRLAAIASLGALLLSVALIVYVTVDDPTVMLALAVLGVVAVAGSWNVLTHRGARRVVAAAVAVGALIASIVIIVVGGDSVQLTAALCLALASVPLARYSLERTRTSLAAAPTPGEPVPAARRPLLIVNPKSGGGKAEENDLAEVCQERGIEVVVLHRGDDLVALAEAAIGRGADVIGMAGGDGSQALVASVAARHDVPHVVVPAGTRNHLALDLGLDRDDVVAALDAFGPALERRIDLAEVNGRVFVNNVSLGAYAQIVQSDEYRDAKLATTLQELPEVLAPDAAPPDLGWTGPDGVHHDGAHLILVSNNQYSLRVGAGAGTRDRLDDGQLGIVVVEMSGTLSAVQLAALTALRRPEGARAIEEWSASTFEVTSGAPVPAGVDGEALELESPVTFRILPGALRVRIPPHAPGFAPATVAGPSTAATIGNVWRVVKGVAPLPPSPS